MCENGAGLVAVGTISRIVICEDRDEKDEAFLLDKLAANNEFDLVLLTLPPLCPVP